MLTRGSFWLVLFAAAALHWRLPPRWRAGFVAAVSFGYLATLQPTTVVTLAGWALVLFHAAPHAAARGGGARKLTVAAVLGLVAWLGYHKYAPPLVAALASNPVAPSLVLPLGISYFTFKLFHYAIEALRGNVPDRSLTTFLAWVFLFPIFSAGPIERFDHFVEARETRWQLDSTVAGLTRIVHGIVKRFLLIPLLELLGVGVPHRLLNLLDRLDTFPAYQIWAFMFLTFVRAYLDFSAYSDIAIGASRLFGFRVMENFDWPLVASNLADFWRRWHRSLAGWCQSYVFFPMLGMTRNPYAAYYATFLVMGLWHGAEPHWILWGFYHATGLSLFVAWTRARRRFGLGPATGPVARLSARVLTLAFVSSASCFTVTHPVAPVTDSFRLLLALLGLAH